MKKNFTVDRSFDNARIDRWIRHNFKKIPQGLIEKNLRIGKIKINKKKVKSSHKVNMHTKKTSIPQTGLALMGFSRYLTNFVVRVHCGATAERRAGYLWLTALNLEIWESGTRRFRWASGR